MEALQAPAIEKINRRKHKGSNFIGALERFLADAEAGRFPIIHRRRDCERINFFAAQLNALHQAENVNELRKYMQKMVYIIMQSSDDSSWR